MGERYGHSVVARVWI